MRVSGGRREMGANVLRRVFKTNSDSCNEFISSSVACRRRSLDPAELVSMKVTARSGRRDDAVFKVRTDYDTLRHTVSLTKLCDKQASKIPQRHPTIPVVYLDGVEERRATPQEPVCDTCFRTFLLLYIINPQFWIVRHQIESHSDKTTTGPLKLRSF